MHGQLQINTFESSGTEHSSGRHLHLITDITHSPRLVWDVHDPPMNIYGHSTSSAGFPIIPHIPRDYCKILCNLCGINLNTKTVRTVTPPHTYIGIIIKSVSSIGSQEQLRAFKNYRDQAAIQAHMIALASSKHCTFYCKENTQSEAFSKHNLVPFVATHPVCTCAWKSTDPMFLPSCGSVLASIEEVILVISGYTGQWLTL